MNVHRILGLLHVCLMLTLTQGQTTDTLNWASAFTGENYDPVASPYQGFTVNNVLVAQLRTSGYVGVPYNDGNGYAVIGAEDGYFAPNGDAGSCGLSRSSPFTLVSLDIVAAWDTALAVTFVGTVNGITQATQTATISHTEIITITFDPSFSSIDSLTISSVCGACSCCGGGGNYFAFRNVQYIPDLSVSPTTSPTVNPHSPISSPCPRGFSYYATVDRCYAVYVRRASWYTGNSICNAKSKHAHLLSIATSFEEEHFYSEVLTKYNITLWTGLNKVDNPYGALFQWYLQGPKI